MLNCRARSRYATCTGVMSGCRLRGVAARSDVQLLAPDAGSEPAACALPAPGGGSRPGPAARGTERAVRGAVRASGVPGAACPPSARAVSAGRAADLRAGSTGDCCGTAAQLPARCFWGEDVASAADKLTRSARRAEMRGSGGDDAAAEAAAAAAAAIAAAAAAAPRTARNAAPATALLPLPLPGTWSAP